MSGFGPLGSYPLAGSGPGAIAGSGSPNIADAGVIASTIAPSRRSNLTRADTMTVAAALNVQVWPWLADSANAAAEAAGEVLANLIERIALTDGLLGQRTLVGNASDSGAFTESINAAWSLLLADTAEGAETMTGTVLKYVAVAEAMAAVDAAHGRLDAYAAVAIAVAVQDAASNGWNANAVDQAALTDAAAATLSAMLALADSLQASDGVSGRAFVSLVAADTLAAVDSPAAALRAVADLESSAMLYVSLRLGDADYHGWALNTDLKAMSEHRNVQFDSIAVVKGRHFAAGPMGIVEITGDTDDGANIDAHITTFMTDFGTGKFKRTADIWLGADIDDNLWVKVRNRDPNTGQLFDDFYSVTKKQATGQGNAHAEIGRGLKSVFWGLTLQNYDPEHPESSGGDFSLTSIRWKPLTLDRRQ